MKQPLSNLYHSMVFVIKCNSLRLWRLPVQPPRKSHNASESLGVAVKTDPKHLSTESTAKSRASQARSGHLPAAARGNSHGHLASGLGPRCNPAAHFLHGLTSLRVPQASMAWAWALDSQVPEREQQIPLCRYPKYLNVPWSLAQHTAWRGPRYMSSYRELSGLFITQGEPEYHEPLQNSSKSWKGASSLGLITAQSSLLLIKLALGAKEQSSSRMQICGCTNTQKQKKRHESRLEILKKVHMWQVEAQREQIGDPVYPLFWVKACQHALKSTWKKQTKSSKPHWLAAAPSGSPERRELQSLQGEA